MKTLVENLKKLEPQIVTELDLGEASVFQIEYTSSFNTEKGKETYNELLNQFNSRKRVYCETTPPEKDYKKEGRKYLHGGFHETNGYHYTVDSLMQKDANNFHFVK